MTAGNAAGTDRTAGMRHFDAFAASERRLALHGSVDPRALPRVAASLAPAGDGGLGWRIAGTVDPCGRPALEVTLDGGVPLVCQRCLRPFMHPVAQTTLLLLARNERELASLDDEDEHEVVLADRALDARELVEEELLLTLPYVPRCAAPDCGTGGPIQDSVAAAAGSPFAALADLAPASGRKRRN